MYKKSSKKYCELKCLYHLLEDQFEMNSVGVRPLKATGTRWIDHKIAAGVRHREIRFMHTTFAAFH